MVAEKLNDISSQDSIMRMFRAISTRRGGRVSDSTRNTFSIYIRRFCGFCDMTPDELILDRTEDSRSIDILTRRRHEELVMKFAQYLRDENYSSNTVSTAIGAVRSFYRTNYYPLVEVNVPSGRPVRVYKVPSKEELAQAIDEASLPWHKAFMVLTKDCGMSLQDLLTLKGDNESPVYGSINQQIRAGQVPIHVHIIRKKTLIKYDTFLGEDSFELLNDYPELIARSLSSDKRLFPYSDTAIQLAMIRFGKVFGWKNFTPYSLRKWFRTQLTLDDMNEALIETMMGHSLGKIKSAYLVPPPQKFMELYQKHYPALKL